MTASIDFVAFNDTSVGAGTHSNTTVYRADADASGLLKDSATGADTGVTLTTLATGIVYQGGGSSPSAGTDAADLFNGFVDFSARTANSLETVAAQGDSYTYRFTGLDPLARYEFTGTAVRGNASYTDRWTLVTLVGAESFTAAHSSGIGVITTGLAPNQVAIWTGSNHQAGQGFVAQWDNIDAGADGQFEVLSQQYTGPTPGVGTGTATGAKGYAIKGIRLTQFTPISVPTVVNSTATNVEAFTATVRGTVTDTGNEDPQVTIYYGTTDGGTSEQAWDSSVTIASASADFSAPLSVLAQNTTYFFRSRAVNAAGAAWAPSTASFTTRSLTLPAVSTNPAEDVQAFTAVLPGQVTDTGGDPPVVTLFYGTTDGGTNPAGWDESIDVGQASQAFDALADGLSQNTTYFFIARATNAAGQVWSAVRSFTTQPVTLPAINNSPATQVAPFSATVGGDVTDLGGDAPVVTVYYGTTDGGSNPGAWANAIDIGQTFGAFTLDLGGLTDDTTYFFRSQAVNAAGAVWAAPSLSFRTLVAPTVRISEFMASNALTLTTRIRSTPGGALGDPFAPDWIEVQNLTNQPIDIGGYFLTDDADDLNKWTIPAGVTIPANGYILFFASDENITDQALDELGILHTNYRLGAGGEYLAIVDPSGQVVHAYAPQFPPQQQDISYGLTDSGQEVYFSTSTPGADNAAGQINFVGDTKFSVDRGFHDAPFDVTISTSTPGASIRYTLDGTTPSANSGTLYTGPIHIDRTTTLRAIAYQAGFVPSNVDTQTYIFIDDVIQQTFQTTLDAGFPTSWNGTAPDYGLDPDVIGPNDLFGGLYTGLIRDSLLSVPTISIVGDINEIFGSSGIYANPTNHSLEISVSAELILPDGEEGFQIDSGLKIQGGAFRSFGLSKKKSLRLKFTAAHGPTKLAYPFFGDDATDEFDTITLRMEANDGWQWSGAGGQPQYARDEFLRQSMRTLGQPASHGERMHVYINGVYWGVYNPVERPDASFASAYFGGEREEWDVQNSGSAVDGNLATWNTLLAMAADVRDAADANARRAAYQKLLGNNPDGSDNPAWETFLDVDNYIDYLIVNWYGGNSDWPSHNYYLGRRRGPDSNGFVFFMWDAEWTLFMRSNINTNRLSAVQGPTIPYDRIKGSEDFKLRFADRVQKAFFEPGGAFYVDPANPQWDPLHPERNVPAALYAAITDDLALPLIAESARWGDQHRTNDPYTVEDEWRTELNHVLNDWFPYRSTVMINQFRAAGLYPTFNAPAYLINGAAQHGGVITTADTITFTAPAGTIFYTLDGSDPRNPDGTIATGAIAYTGGFQIGQATPIAARLRTAGGEWSALSETMFYVNPLAAAGDLIVTEIMYNPPAPTAAELAAQAALDPTFDPSNPNTSHYEFVELMNVSSQAINLDGARFKQVGVGNDGIIYTFSNVVIQPQERFVLAANAAAFEARYGTGVTPMGIFGANLSNGGELLTIVDARNQPLLSFRFNDSGSWPGRADGGGSSLELVNVSGDLNEGNNWRSSSEYLGSPGTAGLGPDNRVLINEVLSHTDPPLKDAIELVNTTAAPIDLSGWFLSDSSNNLAKFRIPDGTILAAGAYLVFDEDDFNPGLGSQPNDFSFNAAHGDDAYLVQADVTTQALQRFVDVVSFGAQANGESWGRYPNATSGGGLTPLLSRTLGSANSAPRIGPVVISEIMYEPPVPAGGLPAGVTIDDLEFVEIHNPTNQAIDLTEWRLRGGVDYDFDPAPGAPGTGLMLPAGGTLVILSFNPLNPLNSDKLNTFRSVYGIDASVPLVGGYAGQLDNSGEKVRLERPDEPPIEEPGFYPRLLEDEVDYEPEAPWPTSAAGLGDSLHRTFPAGFGAQFTSFIAGAPTPGSVDTGSDTTPPAVAAVLLRGTSWSSAYLDYLSSQGLGDGGYAIPAGANQLLPLAWINADQLAIVFTEDVVVSQGDMDLLGVNVAGQPVLAFSYDTATFTATWTFVSPLAIDKWLIDLSDTVTDAAGNALDGEWTDQVSAFISGDGTAGGTFRFRFDTLPGDVTGDGSVLGDDVDQTRAAQFSGTAGAGFVYRRDVNASGMILSRDVIEVRNRLFTNLPAGQPTPSSGQSIGTSGETGPTTVPTIAPVSVPPRAVADEISESADQSADGSRLAMAWWWRGLSTDTAGSSSINSPFKSIARLRGLWSFNLRSEGNSAWTIGDGDDAYRMKRLRPLEVRFDEPHNRS